MRALNYLLAGALLAAIGVAIAAEEPPENHKKWMKDLGSQMGQLRKSVDVEKNATAMVDVMKEVTVFWKARPSEVAGKSSQEATDGAAAVAKAAQASDKAGIAAGMKLIGAGCKGCHDVHREKVAENVYKIK